MANKLQRLLMLSILIACLPAGVALSQQQGVTKKVQYQHLHWSPDSKSILFSAIVVNSDWSGYQQEQWALYEVNLESKQIIQLIDSSLFGSYSPDGKEIAASTLIAGNWEIVRLARNTRTKQRLTNNPARDMAPFWSPNGEHLVFMSNRDSLMEIYTMKKNGNTVERLTFSGKFKSYNPEWSPDGTKIVYYLSKGDGKDQIHALTLSDNTTVSVTNDDFNNIFPGWTPEGEIIYLADNAKQRSTTVRVVDLEGTQETLPSTIAGYARFSPDGSHLAYIAETEGNLYLANPDGSSPQRLVEGASFLKNFSRQ